MQAQKLTIIPVIKIYINTAFPKNRLTHPAGIPADAGCAGLAAHKTGFQPGQEQPHSGVVEKPQFYGLFTGSATPQSSISKIIFLCYNITVI